MDLENEKRYVHYLERFTLHSAASSGAAADQRLLTLVGSKSRLDFVRAHYDLRSSAAATEKAASTTAGASTTTPRYGRRAAPDTASATSGSGRQQPGSSTNDVGATTTIRSGRRGVRLELKGTNTGAATVARGGLHAAAGSPSSPTHHHAAVAAHAQTSPQHSVVTNDAAGAGTDTGDFGSSEGASALLGPAEADAWMKQHSAEAPHMYARLLELERSKAMAATAIQDLFYNAQTFFASVTPELAQVPGATSTLTLADFVFAVDLQVVDAASPDTVRELMERNCIEQVFLVDDEYEAPLGRDALLQWRDGARAAAQQRMRREQRERSNPNTPGNPALLAGGVNFDSAGADDSEGMMVFTLRYGTHARVSELRRLEARITQALAAGFDAQIQALRDEALTTILLSEQEQGIVRH